MIGGAEGNPRDDLWEIAALRYGFTEGATLETAHTRCLEKWNLNLSPVHFSTLKPSLQLARLYIERAQCQTRWRSEIKPLAQARFDRVQYGGSSDSILVSYAANAATCLTRHVPVRR